LSAALAKDLLFVAPSDRWSSVDVAALGRIIALSLFVSLAAPALATLLGAPLSAALAIYRFPGRKFW
jgi:ABC-type Fe3+ transport system permease subunit